MPLMKTLPASIRPASSSARAISRVHRFAPSPKRDALASSKRVLEIVRAHDGCSRPKDLFVEHAHAGENAGDDGGLVKETGTIDRSSARNQARAALDRSGDLLVHGFTKIVARARPELHAFLHRIPHDLRCGQLRKARQEVIVDGVLDDEAFGRDATLAVVLKARGHRRFRRCFEIRVGKNHKCVGAAEFEYALF